jgi:hypothetical protein
VGFEPYSGKLGGISEIRTPSGVTKLRLLILSLEVSMSFWLPLLRFRVRAMVACCGELANCRFPFLCTGCWGREAAEGLQRVRAAV